MKKSFALVAGGFVVILVYNFLFVSNLLPSYAPKPLMIGEFMFLLLACLFVGSGIGYYLPESRRYIRRPQKIVYTEGASSDISRAVRDGFDGPERLVVGSENTTFRDACLALWQFECVGRRSKWIVRDNRGNDITRCFLSAYDGIATLVPEFAAENDMGVSDRTSEYSDLKDSVEYFD